MSKNKNKSHNEDNITTWNIPPTCHHSLWSTSLIARIVLIWGPCYLLSNKSFMVRVEHRQPKLLPVHLPLLLRQINLAYILVLMQMCGAKIEPVTFRMRSGRSTN